MNSIPFMDIPYFDCPLLTDIIVAAAEQTLGCKLPPSYLQTLQLRNGGLLYPNHISGNSNIPSVGNHLSLPLLMGLGGKDGIDSLYEGVPLNTFLINEWQYPDVGVIICHFGHIAYMLDYSVCHSPDEPQIIFANREWSSSPDEFIVVSRNFTDLISGLEIS